ncbi:hypothetical protein ACFO3A_08865 [Comamonas nitrativorans]|uniref:Uncharacterized protein n=1 Tax=Comamonas nitrativorans TaxID=108437 RepID=A0ABV9H044_9BURK
MAAPRWARPAPAHDFLCINLRLMKEKRKKSQKNKIDSTHSCQDASFLIVTSFFVCRNLLGRKFFQKIFVSFCDLHEPCNYKEKPHKNPKRQRLKYQIVTI